MEMDEEQDQRRRRLESGIAWLEYLEAKHALLTDTDVGEIIEHVLLCARGGMVTRSATEVRVMEANIARGVRKALVDKGLCAEGVLA